MSHFTVVVTVLRNVGTLLTVLQDLGYEVETGNELPLYGWKGDVREETADLVISRDQLASSSNDIGFALQEDGTYSVIISEYDARVLPGFVGKVTRQYAYQTIVEQAAASGFNIMADEQRVDGSRRLLLQKWG